MKQECKCKQTSEKSKEIGEVVATWIVYLVMGVVTILVVAGTVRLAMWMLQL